MSAPVESIMRGVSSFNVGTIADEPVAMMIAIEGQRFREPSVLITLSVVSSRTLRVPARIDLALLGEHAEAAGQFLQHSSLNERRRPDRSSARHTQFPSFCLMRLSSSLATWSSAFEGMHPGKGNASGIQFGVDEVTLMPRSAARNAAAYPPGPAPITAI